MEADWYVDPLGRYDGRYFDGESWTDQVSAVGSLARDPDWPPAEDSDEFGPGFETPAVQPLEAQRVLRATAQEESPVRVVAILGDERGAPESKPARPRRWMAVLALAVALAAVAWWIVSQNGGEALPPADAIAEASPADQLDPAAENNAESAGTESEGEFQSSNDEGAIASSDSAGAVAIEEIEPSEVDQAAGQVGFGSTFTEDDAVDVGELRIANGRALLVDLELWHRSFVAEREISLDSRAGCWFGELGGAAWQSVHCGPVTKAGETILFDVIPLVFEDTITGLIAQPVIDAVARDTSKSPSVELLQIIDGPAPP